MKADLHIHTYYSFDGFSSPKEIVKTAISKGINCIAITDHNEIKGAIEAMRFAFDKDILVIPGIEILSEAGDILGLNVKEIIPDGLSAEKTIEEIKKRGGIAVIPHPFDWPLENFFLKKNGIKNLNIDAIEVFNASVFFKSSNKKAFDFAREYDLAFSAGSDAHQAKFVGRGYLEFKKKINSEIELIEEIKNKKAKVGGKALGFWEVAGNSSVSFRRAIRFYNFKRKFKKKKN